MLSVKNIKKSFGAATVLQDVSFDLEAHKTLAILGRSGCGKTTLLKIIAGLTPGGGEILLDRRDISKTPPQQRGIVYLYQEPLLFPHLNVFENVAFGLRIRKMPDAEVKNRTEAMLESLGLADFAGKMPETLSGGQRQRVAFGRALVIQPRVLLLDEPFGALDANTREQMQEFYKQVAVEKGITSIFVTHDLKEALLIGDRWAYMENGRLDIFDTIPAFAADKRTGVQKEIGFWRMMNDE